MAVESIYSLLVVCLLIAKSDSTAHTRQEDENTYCRYRPENALTAKECENHYSDQEQNSGVFEPSPRSSCNVSVFGRKGEDCCEFCIGEHLIRMCPPSRSCNDLYRHKNGEVESGIFNITYENQSIFEVYCDMKTAGGGWTLVAKVKGIDATMNRDNTAQWMEGQTMGNILTLDDENALGEAYNTVPFREVMIRSLNDPDKHLAWRHPSKHPNMLSIARNCVRIDDGVKISGGIDKLDYYGKREYHFGCTELVYGFNGGDDIRSKTSTNGKSERCPERKNHKIGHVRAILGAFLDRTAERERRHHTKRCVSDFGIGGGFKEMGTKKNRFSINAHWWGKGNKMTNAWKSQAVFVR